MRIIKDRINRICRMIVGSLKTISKKFLLFFVERDEKNNLILFEHIRTYVVLSFFLEYIIECVSRHSIKSGTVFMIVSFFVFCFNSLIIFITYLPSLFVRRKLFLTTFVSLVWLGLGIANGVVTLCRVTPLSIIDILNLPNVLPIIRIYLNVPQIVLICFAILVALAFVVFLAIKAPKSKIRLFGSLVTAICTLILLPVSYSIGTTTKLLSDKFASLPIAYKSYGFPYCFCTSVVDRGIEPPKDYSVNKMDEILNALKKYSDSTPDDTPNVIFVQLESFFDVNDLINVKFSENPIPYFTSLSERGISGYLTMPVVGAGTVNSEFEVLTGMSVDFFGPGEHPFKTVLNSYTCETVAYNLMELGYSTHAIHNYQATFYQRHKIYKNLGFQTFTPLEYMSDVEYNISGAWPKDNVLTTQIMNALKSTDTSDFIMTVSVQGHGKYPPNDLPDDYQPKIKAEFIDGKIEGGLSDINGLEYYVNQLNETDLFIKDLVETIENFDEKTVLVFYGDHLPSLSIEEKDLKSGSTYKTPYVILSNYGLEDSGEEIGDLYSYQLAANVLKKIGVHNGLLTKLHQYYSDSEKYSEWLNDLEYDMLGYNVLGGISQRYVYNGNTEYYPKMADMKLGVSDIVIDRCEVIDGVLYVYGENFTAWSKLIADGTLMEKTVYLKSDLIAIDMGSEDKLPSKIAVAQISDSGTMLGKTDEMLIVSVDAENEK